MSMRASKHDSWPFLESDSGLMLGTTWIVRSFEAIDSIEVRTSKTWRF